MSKGRPVQKFLTERMPNRTYIVVRKADGAVLRPSGVWGERGKCNPTLHPTVVAANAAGRAATEDEGADR